MRPPRLLRLEHVAAQKLGWARLSVRGYFGPRQPQATDKAVIPVAKAGNRIKAFACKQNTAAVRLVVQMLFEKCF